MTKDCWDKAEILGKVTGTILVPIAAAFIAFSWNNAKSSRDTAVQMTTVAIGILSESNTEGQDAPNQPLREWAISVLQSPQNPPPIGEKVANSLRNDGASLPVISGSIFDGARPLSEDNIERLLRRLPAPDAPRTLGSDLLPLDPLNDWVDPPNRIPE